MDLNASCRRVSRSRSFHVRRSAVQAQAPSRLVAICLAGLAAIVLTTTATHAQSVGSPARLQPSSSTSSKLLPRVVRDGAGGVLVSWQDQGGGVYSQRLTPQGGVAPGWPGAGTLVSAVGSTDNISTEP